MLRIGKINFLNLYPVFYTLERECDPSFFQFFEGTPSEVNRLLRDGMIEISPSSSIEYLRRPEKYTLIDGHSISSAGAVQSILLFSRYNIEELDGKTVLATAQSETSTALLKIILKKFYELEPDIRISGSDIEKGLTNSAAYMLIGDDAMAAEKSSLISGFHPSIHVYDLGEIWYRETGLPFVFALWIGRKECCKHEDFLGFIDLLDNAREFAVGNFEEIARSARRKDFMSSPDLVTYWKNISYDLGKAHKKGLDLFRKYLTEEELI